MAAAITVGVAVVASRMKAKSTGDAPVVSSKLDYVATLAAAEKLTTDPLKHAIAGTKLTTAEVASLQKAQTMYDALSGFAPKDIVPCFLSGKIAFVLGDTQRASEKLRQAIADAPANPDPKKVATIAGMLADADDMLSAIDFANGNFRAALDDASTALKIDPNFPPFLVSRARAEIELRQLDQAKQDLKTALKADPNFAPAETLLKFISKTQ